MKRKEDIEEYETRILKDIDNTISALKKSKYMSSYYYNMHDLHALYDLCNMLEIENYPKYDIINKKSAKKIESDHAMYLYKNYIVHSDFIYQLSSNILNFYDSIPNHKLQRDFLTQPLDIENVFEYSVEFLKYFNTDFFKILYEMMDDARIIMVNNIKDDEYASGYSYTSYGNYNPYILLVYLDCIIMGASLSHEIAHIHNYMIDNTLSNQQKHRIKHSYTDEAKSFYTEIMFNEYFRKCGILKDDIDQIFVNMNANYQCFAKDVKDDIQSFIDTKLPVFDDKVLYSIQALIGCAIGFYLAARKDKDEALQILNKINLLSYDHDVLEIIDETNMDLDDIINFNSAGEYIRKRLK